MATLAPSFASPSAMALPMPRLPPVTMAALPLRSRSMCAPTPVGLLCLQYSGTTGRAVNYARGHKWLPRPPCDEVGTAASGIPARKGCRGSAPSNGLVAQGRFPAPHALKVLQQDVDYGVLVALRLARGMRRNEHIRHGPKGRGGRQRFLARHVEPGGGQALLLQGLNQGRFVDDAAARDIDQGCRGLHQTDRLGIDQVLRFWRERTGKRNDIGLRQKLAQAILPIDRVRSLRASARIAPGSDDAHFECPREPRQPRANAAKTDDQ